MKRLTHQRSEGDDLKAASGAGGKRRGGIAGNEDRRARPDRGAFSPDMEDAFAGKDKQRLFLGGVRSQLGHLVGCKVPGYRIAAFGVGPGHQHGRQGSLCL